MDLVCLHHDAHLIVVDKPAGLPAVPGRSADLQDCASSRVQHDWPDALVVHRLDMHTSGLLLFARGIEMQRRLSRAFAGRVVHKRYVAVVSGLLPEDSGVIDLPIAADWPNRPRQQVDFVNGKESITHWRVITHDVASTRIELEPVTGRTHQLRVHLAAIGHPILGDRLYAPDAVQVMAPRLLLHAAELALTHPGTGLPAQFKSAPPF